MIPRLQFMAKLGRSYAGGNAGFTSWVVRELSGNVRTRKLEASKNALPG